MYVAEFVEVVAAAEEELQEMSHTQFSYQVINVKNLFRPMQHKICPACWGKNHVRFPSIARAVQGKLWCMHTKKQQHRAAAPAVRPPLFEGWGVSLH
jgi:hypothetical protein